MEKATEFVKCTLCIVFLIYSLMEKSEGQFQISTPIETNTKIRKCKIKEYKPTNFYNYLKEQSKKVKKRQRR